MKISRWTILPPAAWLFFSREGAHPRAAPAPATPAEQKISQAEKAIEKSPGYYQHYNDLALALALRARETSDTAYYDKAEKALRKSFELSKNNFEGRKVLAWVFLGKHEFAKALEVASELNRQAPDDLFVYGLLTDAHVELGNYKKAVDAAQWMLDLRPDNVPGHTRAAYLRELTGDIEGALEYLVEALKRTPPAETENRAWILTQIAHLHLSTGKIESAERALDEALRIFPGYHYALAQLAEARLAQGRNAEAVELLRQQFVAAPHPENFYTFVDALEKAGQREEAVLLYAEFEKRARQEMEKWDNANRELIFYYADKAGKPAEALRLARFERARRRDVYTLDSYAWALYSTGNYRRAYTQIKKALALGIRDPKILYHAGAIALRLNRREEARRHLQNCLDTNPLSPFSAPARKALSSPR